MGDIHQYTPGQSVCVYNIKRIDRMSFYSELPAVRGQNYRHHLPRYLVNMVFLKGFFVFICFGALSSTAAQNAANNIAGKHCCLEVHWKLEHCSRSLQVPSCRMVTRTYLTMETFAFEFRFE